MPRRPVETCNELPHKAVLIVALIFFWSDAKSHEATTGWHLPDALLRRGRLWSRHECGAQPRWLTHSNHAARPAGLFRDSRPHRAGDRMIRLYFTWVGFWQAVLDPRPWTQTAYVPHSKARGMDDRPNGGI